jgi:trehalose/maltose hydrolase-like predicted phosphorylase
MFGKVKQLFNRMDQKAVKKVKKKISLSDEELNKWEEVRHKLNLVISEEGIIAQYDGYFDLEELDWDHYREKYGNIYRMDRLLKAEGKSADDFKVAKQADTLMTFYNLDQEQVNELLDELGYDLPEDYLERNLNYYLARTSHGSTLSRVVHAQLAEMIGDRSLSLDLYLDALGSDYNDIQGGTTAEGIHAGVMAGTLMIAISTFAGIDLRGDVLRVNPALPERWKRMQFNLQFRKARYSFDISHETIIIKADKKVSLLVQGNKHTLEQGAALEVKS